MVYNIKGDAMSTFDLVKKWKAHDRYILKCQWSPDGKYVGHSFSSKLSRLLATTSADHTAKIWKTEDWGLHTALEGNSEKISLNVRSSTMGLGLCLLSKLQLLDNGEQ